MALTNVNAAAMWTQQSVNTAQNGRFHIGALFPFSAGTTGMTGWRDGVIIGTNTGGAGNVPNDLQIKAITPTPSLSLTVEAGRCLITRSGNGPFLGYNAAQATLTLAAADPTNPRVDRIVAQSYDTTLGDSVAGLNPALAAPGALVIRAVTGTPAGSPVAVALAANQISLATVAVAANATAITNGNITDTRKGAYNPSGIRTLLPGDAVGDAGAVSGEMRFSFAANVGGACVWNGTTWQRITPRVAPDPGITGGLVASSGERLLATVVVPDIGGAYFLEAGGHCNVVLSSGSNAAVGIQVRIDGGGVWDDNSWHTGGRVIISDATGFSRSVVAPMRLGPATLTGSHTIQLITKNLAAGPTYTVNTGGAEFQSFCVKQIPLF